jgi:hypothetical protein
MKNNGMTWIASTIFMGVVVYTGQLYSANAQDAINPQTGEIYPGTGAGGSINPGTGEYYPGTGGRGSINPGTGEYYPGTGGNINPNTGMPD